MFIQSIKMAWESITEDTKIYIDHKKSVAAMKTKMKFAAGDSIINVEKTCDGVFMDEVSVY